MAAWLSRRSPGNRCRNMAKKPVPPDTDFSFHTYIKGGHERVFLIYGRQSAGQSRTPSRSMLSSFRFPHFCWIRRQFPRPGQLLQDPLPCLAQCLVIGLVEDDGRLVFPVSDTGQAAGFHDIGQERSVTTASGSRFKSSQRKQTSRTGRPKQTAQPGSALRRYWLE